MQPFLIDIKWRRGFTSCSRLATSSTAGWSHWSQMDPSPEASCLGLCVCQETTRPSSPLSRRQLRGLRTMSKTRWSLVWWELSAPCHNSLLLVKRKPELLASFTELFSSSTSFFKCPSLTNKSARPAGDAGTFWTDSRVQVGLLPDHMSLKDLREGQKTSDTSRKGIYKSTSHRRVAFRCLACRNWTGPDRSIFPQQRQLTLKPKISCELQIKI